MTRSTDIIVKDITACIKELEDKVYTFQQASEKTTDDWLKALDGYNIYRARCLELEEKLVDMNNELADRKKVISDLLAENRDLQRRIITLENNQSLL